MPVRLPFKLCSQFQFNCSFCLLQHANVVMGRFTLRCAVIQLLIVDFFLINFAFEFKSYRYNCSRPINYCSFEHARFDALKIDSQLENRLA